MADLNTKFQVGDRVWYVDNDPSDTGTVQEVYVSDDGPYEVVFYRVKFDTPEAEPVGAFHGRQLEHVGVTKPVAA